MSDQSLCCCFCVSVLPEYFLFEILNLQFSSFRLTVGGEGDLVRGVRFFNSSGESDSVWSGQFCGMDASPA